MPREIVPRDLNVFAREQELFSILGEKLVIKTGTYTGTGVALSVFTEINPLLIIVLDEGSAVPVLWITDNTANTSKQFDGSTFTDAILGPTTTRDGFKIGTNADVNTLSTVYFYVVIGK